MKFNILKDVDENSFHKNLKKIRQEKRMTKKQLGQAIGKNEQQIQRYECDMYSKYKQFPTLEVFKKICLVLQTSPEVMLGLKFEISDKPYYVGVIYEWKKTKDGIKWVCPNCSRENITYINFNKNKNDLLTQEYMCEYDDCGLYFNRLESVNG